MLKVVCPGPGVVVLRNDSKPGQHIGVINGKGAVKANVSSIAVYRETMYSINEYYYFAKTNIVLVQKLSIQKY